MKSAGIFTLLALTLMLAGTASSSATETILHGFTGGNGGGTPAADLIFDSRGNIYGTTVVGGNSVNCQGGCGTVFKLTRGSNGHWTETVIYNFQAGTDGKNPYGGVVLDSKGNLYGATVAGGSSGCSNSDGCGTIFKLTPSGKTWKETILYSFTGGTDGAGPGGGLVLDKHGNLYGTTPDGGKANGCGGNGCGVVYQLVRETGGHWRQKVIHTFTGGKDGATGSLGRLILDGAGNVYGIAELGGDVQCGCGTVFKLSPLAGGKWKFAAIYDFTGVPDSGFPYGGLVSDTKGSLYGTTYFGGSNGAGSVFQLTRVSSGYNEHVLYSFQGLSDGGNPTSTLVFGSAGNLYGTSSAGGDTSGDGVVFKLTPSGHTWKESVVHDFGAAPDGTNPNYGLLRDKTGNLYGVTPAGGSGGAGVAYEIKP